MTGLQSDPIPLQQDRSLAEYPTASHWTGQDFGGLTLYAGQAGAALLDTGGPMLDARQANQLYGIDGQLKFDSPLPQAVAEDQYAAKRAELVRNTEGALDSQTFWGKAGRLGAGFVAGALDPINIAASFVPAVGEARIVSGLERAGITAGSTGGRIAIRAATGAVRGAEGQAALEPLIWARAQSLQDDFGPVDVLHDIAFGAALGGGLHTVIGAAGGDHLGETFAASQAGKLAANELETREAALRTGIAQLAEGRPVTVDTVFDAAQLRDFNQAATFDPAMLQTHLQAALDSIRARGAEAQDAVRWAASQRPLPVTPEAVRSGAGMVTETAAQGTPAAAGGEGPGPVETSAGAPIQGIQRPRRAPKTLLQFVAAKGGIRDEGGELAAMDLHKGKTGFQPGFGPVVRKRGLHPDNMRELAESAGFLKRSSEHETTTMRDLYDALEAEIKTGRDYGKPAEHVPDPEYEAHLRHLEEQAALDAPELSEEGLLEEFAKLAAREKPEDIGSDGRHDAFDIPWDDTDAGDAGGEAGGRAPDAGRGAAVAAAEGAGREDLGAQGRGDERRSLDQDGQAVIPGAERISDKDFAERQMQGGKKAAVAQKPADEGLFDVAGRGQSDLFANDPEVKAADEAATQADLYAQAWDAAAACMGSH
jgi:hypothetical protein